MAAGRTMRSLVSRRRRVDEEGEEDEGPVVVEDSQSEGSAITDPEDDEDAEADVSSLDGPVEAQSEQTAPAPAVTETASRGTASKRAKKSRKRAERDAGEAIDASTPHPQPRFKAMADTEAMMNGLQISERKNSEEPVAGFETLDRNGIDSLPRSNGETISQVERQRREHEEYRKKRDTNPAFIPNRGNFFMHDTRGQNNGPAPDRNAWQNRFKPRPATTAAWAGAPINQPSWADRAAEQTWKHDLHDTINEEPVDATATPSAPAVRLRAQQNDSSHLFPKAAPPPENTQHRSLSFDSTVLLGTVQARVYLPGMKAAKVVADVPVRKFVRLPAHRPPLRRDKAVRVVLPGHGLRSAFPAIARSFIFIPRAQRSNQAGYRGYQRNAGYSSRRTSMHGSMYSASVAPSRRSSMAGVSRDRAFSPARSFVGMQPGRPVVRLPHGSSGSTPVAPLSGYHTPTGMQLHTYPLPQMPLQLGTPTSTVHQPRPQKNVDIAGIESQPFHSQLPAHLNEAAQYQAPPAPQPPQMYYSPGPQYQYPPPQPQSTGTPLSGIPEQSMHPTAFQPPAYGQMPYYPGYPPQQGYVYSPPTSGAYPPMPMYMPPYPGYYPPGPPLETPMPQPPAPSTEPQSTAGDNGSSESQQPQSGIVARESNGMVYYERASEARSSERYQPAEGFVPSYAMPGLPPPTPAPDTQMPYYYPPMPHPGMPEVGTPMYYPPAQ